MKIQAEKKSLSLALNNELNNEIYLEGDPFRLKQIIYNLLGNAIKFTEAGIITLAVSGKENEGKLYLNIQVHDTGIGISPEDTRHIFGEFERAENSITNNSSGTGLGLSIVHTLVTSQGGRIYVKSKINEGSCFTVYLPFIKAEKPDQIAIIREQIEKAPYPGKVWMVDDDGFILELCSSIFEKNNIDHKCFGDPMALLKEAPDEKLSCVLVDMRMPGLNGAELCSILRKKLPAGMYIFALTAEALPWEQENVMRLGFDGLLMKPFKEAELLDLIYSTVDEQLTTAPEQSPDLEAVTEMAFGDSSRILMILNQFVSDSLSDSEQIRASISAGNIEDSLLLLHRIAGRVAQIGSSELAGEFRLAEINLGDSNKISAEFERKLEDLLQKLAGLTHIISQQSHPEKLSLHS
jgi:FixJ family two-component response regulator/anti-sigma regulatory factor (Ser/Thr protein kinase)